jgi:hypothetical protein
MGGKTVLLSPAHNQATSLGIVNGTCDLTQLSDEFSGFVEPDSSNRLLAVPVTDCMILRLKTGTMLIPFNAA